MTDLFLVLFWSGPIGVGFFLMGLGVFFWASAASCTRGSSRHPCAVSL